MLQHSGAGLAFGDVLEGKRRGMAPSGECDEHHLCLGYSFEHLNTRIIVHLRKLRSILSLASFSFDMRAAVLTKSI
jgi:hypothetical protein